MALKDWKISKHHARPETKISWESKEGDTLAIDYNKSYGIPYRLILNDAFTIDSTNAFVRIKKLAVNYMRVH
jgi:hypothetical protein